MNSIIDKLKSNNESLGVCWMGNAGWLLACGGHLIAFDLDLTSSMRLKKPPITPKELAGSLEYLFITHGHGDHFNVDTCRKLLNGSSCIFVLPESCKREAEEIGIPENRILWVKPDLSFSPASWLHVNTTRALHGHIEHSVYEYANMLDCGYRLQFSGKTIYQPGDSVLLHQHLDMDSVDLLFVSPTEHNTHLEGSVSLINAINPEKILAQHFGTYEVDEGNAYWTVGFPEELGIMLPLKFKDSFNIPKQGDIYYI